MCQNILQKHYVSFSYVLDHVSCKNTSWCLLYVPREYMGEYISSDFPMFSAKTYWYCTISIDSSVTRHKGYLTCRNMGTVTVSRRVLTKGQKMWQPSLWQFWPKFGYCVRKRVNLASAAWRRCMLHLKLSQTVLKYPASVRHLTKYGPCHTLKSQVTKWKFCQPCHSVTRVTNQSKLYSRMFI